MVAFMKSPVALVALLLSSVVSVTSQYTTTNVTKFTPEELLSISRRGTALPNADGTLALYTTSQHSFDTHKNKYGLWVLDLTNGSSWLFTNSSAVSDPNWLEGNTFVWFVGEDDGTTSVAVGDATTPDAE